MWPEIEQDLYTRNKMILLGVISLAGWGSQPRKPRKFYAHGLHFPCSCMYASLTPSPQVPSGMNWTRDSTMQLHKRLLQLQHCNLIITDTCTLESTIHCWSLSSHSLRTPIYKDTEVLCSQLGYIGAALHCMGCLVP